jgi:hypothetical protein
MFNFRHGDDGDDGDDATMTTVEQRKRLYQNAVLLPFDMTWPEA